MTLSAPLYPSCISSSSLKYNPKCCFSSPKHTISVSKPCFPSFTHQLLSFNRSISVNLCPSVRPNTFVCSSSSTVSSNTTNYEFSDGSDEVELRLFIGDESIQSSKDVFVDADEKFLTIKTKHEGAFKTAMEISLLLDEDQLIVNLKKQDPDVKWPDIMETWESLTVGVAQLLKGTSVYLVGESSEINYRVSRELAVGLGYTPLDTKELLETFTKQTLDSWSNAVAETESAILESLNEAAAKEEARMNVASGGQGFTNADVVVKLGGSWDNDYSKAVAQAALSALKQLILSDKKLPGVRRVYIYDWDAEVIGPISNLLAGTRHLERFRLAAHHIKHEEIHWYNFCCIFVVILVAVFLLPSTPIFALIWVILSNALFSALP
ncbi:hypothetical protein M8C21_021854 [Ambrosia artemisiifolia]|uniref:CS domain-containing protein n=1 Tax=Ambrosia artemisiifolia TaxID=4212 RepID=A0AAD5BSX4_AMBAR|nr:hypothetical protein M8C21_021854 [Ambrosia artemisiifolia]